MTDQADTVCKAYTASALPVPYAPSERGARRPRMAVDTGFAAQMLGGSGQGRGLKGGAPVLQAARRAYLRTEWSGRGDRRALLGALGVTHI